MVTLRLSVCVCFCNDNSLRKINQSTLIVEVVVVAFFKQVFSRNLPDACFSDFESANEQKHIAIIKRGAEWPGGGGVVDMRRRWSQRARHKKAGNRHRHHVM